MLIDRLRARGKASEHKPCKNHVSLTIIESEEVKDVALEMLEDVGVKILFYVFCSDVIKEGNDVKGVIIESKEGREAILAKTVIAPETEMSLSAQASSATRATLTAACNLLP